MSEETELLSKSADGPQSLESEFARTKPRQHRRWQRLFQWHNAAISPACQSLPGLLHIVEQGESSIRTAMHLTLIGTLLLVGAGNSYAKCKICWEKGGKTTCVEMSYDCKTQKANSAPELWAQVSCADLLVRAPVNGGNGLDPFSPTRVPHGISLPSDARSRAAEALAKAGIFFFVDKSSDPRRILILVDEASLTNASQVLRRSSIKDLKVEGPVQPRSETL